MSGDGAPDDGLRLGFVALAVPDVAATCDFYRLAFGLEVRWVDDSGELAELAGGTARLAVLSDRFAEAHYGVAHARTRPSDPPPSTVCTFFTDDVDAAVARALDAGARLARAPFDAPWGQRIAVVRDADGALVELATPAG